MMLLIVELNQNLSHLLIVPVCMHWMCITRECCIKDNRLTVFWKHYQSSNNIFSSIKPHVINKKAILITTTLPICRHKSKLYEKYKTIFISHNVQQILLSIIG